jgi:hypothetical protein
LLDDVLVAPATARYPIDKIESRPADPVDGDRAWIVSGVVDAENSFSALIRQRWECMVVLSGDEFNPIYLKLGDTTVYGSIPPTSMQGAFARIQKGMTEEEALSIMGPGTVSGQQTIDGVTSKLIEWPGRTQDGKAMRIMILNGKVF